jgi:hypothetical protein
VTKKGGIRVSAPRQTRVISLCDLMVVILILGLTYRPEAIRSEDRAVTLLQCKTLQSHEFPLFDKQGSYERLRGRSRTSLSERQLFLVCTDRVSRQLNLRADRSQDDRVETRIPAPE